MNDEATGMTIDNGTRGIRTAANWLAENREAVSGAVIPLLRSRFGLTALEAIEAAKLAHKIEYGGV